MLIKRNFILVVLIALMGISCGTDGLETTDDALSYANASDIPDYMQPGWTYSYTLNIENGMATDVNLTSFTDGGTWLSAQIINNGSAIELSGSPDNSHADTEFSYSITAVKDNGGNAVTSFAVYVDE